MPEIKNHTNTSLEVPHWKKQLIIPQTLDHVDCDHTYLGVEIKNDLKWNLHVNKIRSEANRSLGFLRRYISSCSRTTKVKAFNSLVRPHLEYSCTVWDPYTQELITQLDKVQRRGTRFVFDDYNYTSSP